MSTNTATWSDAQLESMIRRNLEDRCLWDELYRRLHRGVHLAIKSRCRSDDNEAAALVQDAFVAAWEQRKKWKRKSSLAAYIHGIARNKSREWIRGQQDRRNRFVPVEPIDETLSGDLKSPQTAVDESLVHGESVTSAYQHIKAHFERKPKHWGIICLTSIEKIPDAQAATKLGIRSANALARERQRLVTALTKLREKHNITVDQLRDAMMRCYDEMP